MHLNAGNKQLQSLCITCSPGYEEQIPCTLRVTERHQNHYMYTVHCRTLVQYMKS